MRRHLPRLLMTGALLSPVTLHALGLGEIRLSSALNQPFDAEIELISPTRDELLSLKVGLAEADLFNRYGIDRPAFLSGFEFSVGRSGDGGTAIKVTSSRPVTEPFVTLLVEASWGRGRLLREYTVLLDPPVFMPAQPEAPAPVATPQAGAQADGRIERTQPEPVRPDPVQSEEPAAEAVPEPASMATPASAPVPRTETPAQPAARSLTQGGEYVVERNDTLWRIAQATNPGATSVVNRTMIALFRANPHAFNGNINRLLAGSVLRIPDLAEIDAISGSEASVEVARQTAEWSGALPVPSAEEASRLRLVTPEEIPTEPAPAPAGRGEAGSAPGDTGRGAAAQDRRVEIDSETLAGVQRTEDVPAGEAEFAPEAEADTDAEAAPAVPETEEQAAVRGAPAQQPADSSPSPTLFERLAQHWWVPVVAGLLLVLGLVLAFIRRRREESESQAAFAALEQGGLGQRTEPGMDTSQVAQTGMQMRSGAGAAHTGAQGPAAAGAMALRDGDPADSFSGRQVEKDFEEDARGEPQPPASVSAEPDAPMSLLEPEEAPALAADETLSSETAVRFDQQDALAEADFHMAYGLYDQAADLVKIAIDREPARRDLKLKLLEIYFVWGNKDLFLDTARGLHAGRDNAAAGEWDKVLIMGRQIAGDDPMFQGEAGAAHVDLVDVNLEGGENRVDVDLFAEVGTDTDTDVDTASSGLDLQLSSGEYEFPVQALAPAQADEGLDFLLEDDSTSPSEESLGEDTTRTPEALARTQETPTIESPFLDAPTTELASLDSPTIESAAPDAMRIGQSDSLATSAIIPGTAPETTPETTLGGSVLSATALDEQEGLTARGLGDIDPDKTLLAPVSFAEDALRDSVETDRSDQTIREQIDKTVLAKYATDQTAELSIDDLGLDVDALEPSALEDTGSLERDPTLLEATQIASADNYAALAETQEFVSLQDDEATLPPSSGSFDRTLEVPRATLPDPTDTGTIYVDGLDIGEGVGSDTTESRYPDADATASMKMPADFTGLGDVSPELGLDLDDVSQGSGLDLDLSEAAGAGAGDTVEQRRLPDADRFLSDVFTDGAAEEPSIDLDLGEPLSGDDDAPTNKQNTAILELSELDPVTMSEVGTKLDLARAYMDMGDPDGARSILDEVVAEGNPSQKQEAQRLLDSIR
ncbi:hypothetical protein ACG33_10375 [Steroidobacter denitrificans]|uniref:FimV N-terminal domain-containing protein n=1 Tax=Steroidobacter denitrificans TaxID=465721 RepID=A0A127FD15_STEDE|nr:FimV/HubP family polar landmark protein [Steroidobacter denitrificans]AMN47495.1 hypothetical protein ACG33_10375 [Steroidobacter denitrificans]